MANDHLDYVTDYVASAQSILQSGKLLKTFINSEPAKREYAVSQLERAAQRHLAGGENYRNFMFAQAGAAPIAELGERSAEDVLATIMADLNASNLLMACGQNIGEVGGQKDPHLLDLALFAMDRSVKTVEVALPGPLTSPLQPGRLGFAGAPAPKQAPSADLPTAIANYQTRADGAIDALVADAKEAVMAIINALSKLKPDQVADALDSLGAAIAELPRVGRLFRQGLEILKQALDSLTRLLGKDLMGAVKDYVSKIWDKLKDGKYLESPIVWAFGGDGLKDEVGLALKNSALQIAKLDEGSAALAELSASFKEKMGLLSGVSAAVSLAGTLLFLVPGVGTQLTIVAGSIYVIVLAGIVLIGRDYTDSGPFKQVRGIRELTRDVVK
ncbi:MAG TPA: hypothetical protein VN696_01280 [Pyrinomonadaceae bacterium]|nr:hypothetical protein [Pyrinomonadaceae bacterium]